MNRITPEALYDLLPAVHRLRDERGASLVEYALMLALIAMVCIAAVTALGSTTSGSFSEATSMLG